MVPSGLVGIAFKEPQPVPDQSLSALDAATLRESIDGALQHQHRIEDGHERWFFGAFDRDYLYFFVARYQRNPIAGLRPWATYVIERRYRVRRGGDAAEVLEVADILAQYEVGIDGVKAGMSESAVRLVVGAPLRIEQLGPKGAFDYVFSRIVVRFLNDRVASVSRSTPDSADGLR